MKGRVHSHGTLVSGKNVKDTEHSPMLNTQILL